MIQISSSGRKIKQTSTWIEVDGKRYDIPKSLQGRGSRLETNGGTIYVNGARFDPDTGEFLVGTVVISPEADAVLEGCANGIAFAAAVVIMFFIVILLLLA